MTRKILITGAAGLLGSRLVERLAMTNQITATYHVHPAGQSLEGVEYWQLDLADPLKVKELFRGRQYDFVINCAGASDVDRCESEQVYALNTNLEIVRNLLKRIIGMKTKLIHFSSDYVFNGMAGPYIELDTPDPLNFYGQTKLMAERAILESQCDATIIRVCSLYSKDPNAPDNILKKITATTNRREVYKAAEDVMSNPTDVGDLSTAIEELLRLHRLPHLLHLAAPENLSRFQFGMKMAQAFNIDASLIENISVSLLKLAAKRPRFGGLNSELAYKLIGRQLKTPSEVLSKAQR